MFINAVKKSLHLKINTLENASHMALSFAVVLSRFSRVRLFVTSWPVARQAPLSTILQAGILEWVSTPSSRGQVLRLRSSPVVWVTVKTGGPVEADRHLSLRGAAEE